jgi:hypothetical protein
MVRLSVWDVQRRRETRMTRSWESRLNEVGCAILFLAVLVRALASVLETATRARTRATRSRGRERRGGAALLDLA